MARTKTLPSQWDRFLKELSDKLSKPSQEIPSVRCLTKKTLSSIFTNIKEELKLPSTFPSGEEVLSFLSSMGLASKVDTEKEEKNAPSKEFYLVGISASHDTMADPLEILQAYRHEGVICYFSALSYYELTTQFPTHHHIATIVEPTPTAQAEQGRTTTSPPSTPEAKERSTKKLGTLAFFYGGIPFYSTRRSSNTIAGVKNRKFNPRTEIRITSKEQTLLDTLHYPLHCGGPEVVFEAWDDQLGSLDEMAFLNLLKTINSQQLTRRLGTLFDFLDYKPKTDLFQFLEATRVEVECSNELTEISLLRGFHYSHANPRWKTLTP